jgi:hypothetical protein
LDNDVEGRFGFVAALYIPGKAMTKESDMALSPSARAIKSVGLLVKTHSLYLALIAGIRRDGGRLGTRLSNSVEVLNIADAVSADTHDLLPVRFPTHFPVWNSGIMRSSRVDQLHR